MIDQLIYEILEEVQLKDPEEVGRLKRAFSKRVCELSYTVHSDIDYNYITQHFLYDKAMYGLTNELSNSGLVRVEEDRLVETNEIVRKYSLYFLRPLKVQNDKQD